MEYVLTHRFSTGSGERRIFINKSEDIEQLSVSELKNAIEAGYIVPARVVETQEMKSFIEPSEAEPLETE